MLKYYTKERERHKDLNEKLINFYQAEFLVKLACEQFHIDPIKVEKKSGKQCRSSFIPFYRKIVLCDWLKSRPGMINFRSVLHEIAHCMANDEKKAEDKHAIWAYTELRNAGGNPEPPRIIKEHWHGPRHQKHMDILCRWARNSFLNILNGY